MAEIDPSLDDELDHTTPPLEVESDEDEVEDNDEEDKEEKVRQK